MSSANVYRIPTVLFPYDLLHPVRYDGLGRSLQPMSWHRNASASMHCEYSSLPARIYSLLCTIRALIGRLLRFDQCNYRWKDRIVFIEKLWS